MEQYLSNIPDCIKDMEVYPQFNALYEELNDLQENPSLSSWESILTKLEKLLDAEEFKEMFVLMARMRDKCAFLIERGGFSEVTSDESHDVNGFNNFAESISLIFGILLETFVRLKVSSTEADCFERLIALNGRFVEMKYPDLSLTSEPS